MSRLQQETARGVFTALFRFFILLPIGIMILLGLVIRAWVYINGGV